MFMRLNFDHVTCPTGLGFKRNPCGKQALSKLKNAKILSSFFHSQFSLNSFKKNRNSKHTEKS